MNCRRVSIQARDLLPHREPMLLVDELVEIDGNRGLVRAQVAEATLTLQNHPNTELGSHWAIEYIAQAVAAFFGFNWREKKRGAAIGFIVAIDQFEVLGPGGLAVGSTLTVDVTLDFDAFPMGVYDGILYKDGNLYARARLKCFVQENEELEL